MEEIRVKGNTYCIVTGRNHLPFYKLGDGEIILMDTGWYSREGEQLQAFLDSRDYRVHTVLLSHAHEDHLGNAKRFKARYGCELVASSVEATFMPCVENMKLNFSELALHHIDWMFRSQFVPADRMILPGRQSVEVAGVRFGVLETPGHSPGHLCYSTPDGVLYVGDVMMSEEIAGRSIRMPYAYVMRQMLDSMRFVAGTGYEKYILCHNGVLEDLSSCFAVNAQHYYDCIIAIYRLLEAPLSLEDVARAVRRRFGFKVENQLRYSFLRQNALAYLQFLEGLGAISQELVDDRIVYVRHNGHVIDEAFESFPVHTGEDRQVVLHRNVAKG